MIRHWYFRRKWLIAMIIALFCALSILVLVTHRPTRPNDEIAATRDLLEVRIGAMLQSAGAYPSQGQRYMFACYRRGVDHLQSDDLIRPFPLNAVLSNHLHWPHPTLTIEWLEKGLSARGVFVEDKGGSVIAEAPTLFHWRKDEQRWFAGMCRDATICIAFKGQPQATPHGPWSSFPMINVPLSLASASKSGLRVGLITTYGPTEAVDVFVDPSATRPPTTRSSTREEEEGGLR